VTIHPTVHIEPIKAGMAARTPEIGLAGHGRDEGRALASLTSVVAIWARSLAQQGLLEGTLARLGVRWEGDGGVIRVEPAVTGDSS